MAAAFAADLDFRARFLAQEAHAFALAARRGTVTAADVTLGE